MNITTLNDIETTADMVRGFRGLFRASTAGEHDFAECENLSSRLYPFAAPREARRRLSEVGTCYGALYRDKLASVRGGEAHAAFYWGAHETGLELEPGEKQLVPMGTKIIIFPDKAYYDTYDGSYGSLEAYFTTAEDVSVRYSLCRSDGSEYSYVSRDTEPSDITDGSYWCDTSSGELVLKQYSESSGMWSAVDSVYIKIAYPGIGKPFSRYDGVEISGSEVSGIDGSFALWEVGDDFLVIAGIIDGERVQTSALTVKRRLPKTDFVTECDNRLWACRYGLDNDGNFVNEIYASKLGDPFNWSCYMGLSTDSYAVSVGSDGAFTGCVSYGGGVLFFKEEIMHRIRGSKPASFTLTSTAVNGVQKGCAKSLAVLDGLLYYKSATGVMTYDGTVPVCISEALGDEKYTAAAAVATPFRYTLYALDAEGAPHFLVYNSARGTWNPEDAPQVEALFRVGVSVCYAAGGYLWLCGGECEADDELCDPTVYESEGAVSWFAETGELGSERGDTVVTKLQLRMRGSPNCPINIEIMTERSDGWESVGRIVPLLRRTYTIPIITGRCDHVRVRLSGEGDFTLYSISRYTQEVEG